MYSRNLYIDLLQRAVRNEFYRKGIPAPSETELERSSEHIKHIQEKFGSKIGRLRLDAATIHRLWHANTPLAHTLCDHAQLENVRRCVEHVLDKSIPGDLIETGVYRGGQTIFMRGLLKAYGVTDRRVFVADSFEGLPTPEAKDVDDAIAVEVLEPVGRLASGIDEVKSNFASYDLLDDQVVFLKGWFKDTLPIAPIDRLAVMRLDGDLYDSTMDALQNLYPKLSSGGFAIIDDYGIPIGCRRAVDEYRARHGIVAPLQPVNRQTVFWQKA